MPLRLTRRAVAALLTLGVGMSTVGCSTTPYGPGMKPWAPPALCLEPCKAMPDPLKLSREEWDAQMVEGYTHCAVTHNLCSQNLIKGD